MKSKYLIACLLILLFVAVFSNIFNIYIINYLWILLTLILIFNIKTVFKKKISINYNFCLSVFFLFFLLLLLIDISISIIKFGNVSYIYKFGKPSEENNFIVYLQVLIFLIITMFCVQLVTVSRLTWKKSLADRELGDKEILLLLIFFFLGLVPYISNGLQSFFDLVLLSRAAGGGNSQFGMYGGGTTVKIFLHNLLITSGLVSGYFLYNKSIKNIKFIICLVIFLVSIIIVASSGTRTKLGLIIVPLIFSNFFKNRNNRNFLLYFKYVIVLLVMTFILSIMVKYRSVGISAISDDNSRRTAHSLDVTGTDLGAELFVIAKYYTKPLACNNLPECFIFPAYDTVIKFITNPIPRRFWKDKYIDPSFTHFNKLRTGHTGLTKKSGTNITPTVIGRYYMLYGWPGVIFSGLVFGVSLGVMNNFLISSRSKTNADYLIIFCFLYYFCQSIRDLVPGWLYGYLFFIIYFLICNYSNNKT